MNDDAPHPSADEAREALTRATSMRVTSPRDLAVLRGVLLGVGALMALILPMIQATRGNAGGFALGMGVYVLGLAALLVVQHRLVRAAPRGYQKWYVVGVAATSVLYGIGVTVVSNAWASWPIVWLLALLVVAPAAFCASRIGRSGR